MSGRPQEIKGASRLCSVFLSCQLKRSAANIAPLELDLAPFEGSLAPQNFI